jgi:hypothetical protein
VPPGWGGPGTRTRRWASPQYLPARVHAPVKRLTRHRDRCDRRPTLVSITGADGTACATGSSSQTRSPRWTGFGVTTRARAGYDLARPAPTLVEAVVAVDALAHHRPGRPRRRALGPRRAPDPQPAPRRPRQPAPARGRRAGRPSRHPLWRPAHAWRSCCTASPRRCPSSRCAGRGTATSSISPTRSTRSGSSTTAASTSRPSAPAGPGAPAPPLAPRRDARPAPRSHGAVPAPPGRGQGPAGAEPRRRAPRSAEDRRDRRPRAVTAALRPDAR